MVTLALVQGLYCLFMGIWALVQIVSFSQVTGRRTHLWLAQMVGLVAVAIGCGLILAGTREHFDAGIILLAIASASGLMGMDLVQVMKGAIAPICAVDAAVQLGFVMGWMACCSIT